MSITFDPNQLATLVVLGVACATVTTTITRASIFSKFRVWVDRKSRILGDLLSCPYCTSHWIAFITTAVFQPRPINTGKLWLDIGPAWAVLTFVSALGCSLLIRAFTPDDERAFTEDDEP